MPNDMTKDTDQAQPQSRLREPINLSERLALSPKEFGEALGKSATYGYRQIYSGRVRAICDAGRFMIPRSEIDRFLSRATEYNGQPQQPSKAA